MTPEALGRADRAELEELLRSCGLQAPEDLSAVLDSGFGRGIRQGGQLVACSLRLPWGRVQPIACLAVHPDERRRGIGSALGADLARQLLSSECVSSVVDLPAESLDVLAFLCARGFKALPPRLLLRYSLADEPPRPEGPGDEEGALQRVRELAEAEWPEALDQLCAALQPGLSLGPSLSRLEERAMLRLRGLESEGRLVGLAWSRDEVESREIRGFLIAPESEALEWSRALLGGLTREAREEGLEELSLALPGRQALGLRAALELGFRPRAQGLRLSVAGHPEALGLRGVLVLPCS